MILYYQSLFNHILYDQINFGNIFFVSGSKMCLLHHCYGDILDNRSAPYSGDVIASHNSVSNGGVT